MTMDELMDKLRELGLIEEAKTGIKLTGKGYSAYGRTRSGRYSPPSRKPLREP